jgi:hypothetical protein
MVALMSERDTLAQGAGNSNNTSPASNYTNTALLSGLGGGSVAITTPSPNHVPISIPLRPIWVGLTADTLLFATLWLVTWSVLTIPRRFVREVARFRSGACIECGYDLGYDFIHGCPECGWRRDRQMPSSRAVVSERVNGD